MLREASKFLIYLADICIFRKLEMGALFSNACLCEISDKRRQIMKKVIVSLVLILLTAAPAFCETSVWIAKTDSTVMYIGPPEFDRAYEASEILVFETDIARLANPETQQAIMAKSTYADGRTLDKILSADVYKKLEELCTKNGLPLASMNQFKPSIIMITLLGLELQKLGVNQEGIDAFYHAKATPRRRPTKNPQKDWKRSKSKSR